MAVPDEEEDEDYMSDAFLNTEYVNTSLMINRRLPRLITHFFNSCLRSDLV